MTDPRFNGMNGDILVNTQRGEVALGRVSGKPYGYDRRLLVTFELRVERLKRQEVYETIEHEQVHEPLDFAITTSVWRPDQQDIVECGRILREQGPGLEFVEFSHGFTERKAAALAALEKWHMNSFQAACAHQTVVYEEKPYHRPSLELTPACPITGYKYGHSWLVKPLPDDFVGNLLSLLHYAIEDYQVYVHPSLKALEV